MNKSFLLLAAATMLATACSKKEDATPATMQLSGSLSGANEAPAVTSSGTGAVSGTYNPSSKMLTYTVTYAGITPTAGHFHIGAPGTSGPVAISFTNGLASPITGSVTLSDTQIDALKAGNMYVNLHTSAYPADGELRANVVAK